MTVHVFSFTVVCVPYVWQKIIIITTLSRKYLTAHYQGFPLICIELQTWCLVIYQFTIPVKNKLLFLILLSLRCLAWQHLHNTALCTYFLNAYTLWCQPKVFSAAQIMEDKETGDKNTTWKPFKICHSVALCTDRFSINPNSVQNIKPLLNGIKEF